MAVAPVGDAPDPPAEEAPEPAPPPPAVSERPTLVPEHAGFVASRASEATCATRQAATQTKIDALARGCATPDDCAVVRSVCPLGCWAVVAKGADDRDARRAIDRYFRDCPVCKSKCAPLPQAVACVDGTCQPG